MKYAKMLGLAAVAAMALMAFLGASSASATVLCSTNTTPCSSDYASGTTIEATLASGTSAVLRNTSGAIENTCTTSTVTGSTNTTGGAGVPVTGTVATAGLSFGGCSNTTDVLEGGTLSVSYTSGMNGTLSATKFRVTMNLAGVSCTYGAGAGTTLGTVTGGEPAAMSVLAVVNKKEGSFLCPADAVWEAGYTVTSPNSLWLANS